MKFKASVLSYVKSNCFIFEKILFYIMEKSIHFEMVFFSKRTAIQEIAMIKLLNDESQSSVYKLGRFNKRYQFFKKLLFT